jgi:hypothetical protein
MLELAVAISIEEFDGPVTSAPNVMSENLINLRDRPNWRGLSFGA